MSTIYQIIYVSSASTLLGEKELIELLEQSRPRNQKDSITGALLYKDGNIIQAIEGPEDNVRALMAKIKSDNRHRGVIELLKAHIDERHFPNWSMDYINVSKQLQKGFSDFLNPTQSEIEKNISAGNAKNLLLNFRKHM